VNLARTLGKTLGRAKSLALERATRENTDVRWRSICTVVCFGVAAFACLTEPPSQTYGNPNSLQRASFEGGTDAVTCGGEGGAKTFEGGTPTFTNDVFPLVQKWKCGDKNGCHGGGQAPPIDTTTAANALKSLQAISVSGQPYVGGGDGGGGGSIMCNLQGSCGAAMPQTTPAVKPAIPTNDELCVVQAWLAAGAKL
jgi:hypothetical protein